MKNGGSLVIPNQNPCNVIPIFIKDIYFTLFKNFTLVCLMDTNDYTQIQLLESF